MKVVLFELLLLCHAQANTEEMSDEEQHVGRRYAESTIASEISRIMDSMVQKNFVDFLLNQKQKKSKSAAVEEDPEERQYHDLHEKQRRNI